MTWSAKHGVESRADPDEAVTVAVHWSWNRKVVSATSLSGVPRARGGGVWNGLRA
jgi:hypothetical protein